ncbi:PepSY-associated TM helix domain-containing protein [Niveispirillum irakense]|uniref:PepSY-associated TM helix domain-containing protein n=1 Tax=Niveispirillum irakense TaxID=34011 RepID=UPI0004043611|nr:PepSY domain-containing protein [Niveispirillum irakense]
MTSKTANKPYGPIYRAVWRWHFYAGLVTAPFLLILAITGAIYLFDDEINDLTYPHLRFVEATGQPMPLSHMMAAAEAHLPGAVTTRVDTPGDANRSVQFFLSLPDGSSRRVFIDPYRATVLGDLDYRRTLVGFADQMHGTLLMGDAGDMLVELMACWGAVLTVTGLYLWWPSGPLRLRGFLWPRLASGGRALLRDLHGVVGFWTGLLILFLILTGLPWATFWGSLLVGAMDVAGIGYPASHRGYNAPTSTLTAKQVVGEVPWTLEPSLMPVSTPAPSAPSGGGGHAHHHGGAVPTGPVEGAIGIDRAAAIFAEQGLEWPYRLSTPRGETGVYLAFTYPGQPQGQRSLYLDQYTGAVLRDTRFADYGWGAQAVELGVQLHLGRYFGLANQLLMLLPCIGIVLLCITGPWMWWKRRPKGKLGVPAVPSPAKLRNLAMITIGLSALFPLAGASLLAVLIGDRLTASLMHRKAG